MKKTDIIIIGAGPSGLCFALSLVNKGLSVVIIEKQSLNIIENPEFDGREIALTHASKEILENLNIWQNFPQTEINPIVDAQIFNGYSDNNLKIPSQIANCSELGYIISNHIIRKTAFEQFKKQCANFELLTEQSVTSINRVNLTDIPIVTLSNGDQIQASLVVSADSRFSETRRMMGIPAQIRDFGKSMLVCRFKHEIKHHHVAREWFGYGQTIALLPLEENVISVVLTLPHHQIQQINNLDDLALASEINNRTKSCLGKIELISTKHIYPLVSVYAEKFSLPNYALIGDAAIGMHPVTAHGFNFGLISQNLLASLIENSITNKENFFSNKNLNIYNSSLKRKSLPLFKSTNLIVSIFTNDSPLMKLIRNTSIKFTNNFYPFKKFVASQLTQKK